MCLISVFTLQQQWPEKNLPSEKQNKNILPEKNKIFFVSFLNKVYFSDRRPCHCYHQHYMSYIYFKNYCNITELYDHI